MKPEQLIAELEAALHQGESHDWRLLAPLVLDALKAMQAAVERLTAERDKALARNAFLHNETGKALEIIASRIELNPPISAEEQSDIEAVARWVKAIGAEQVARCMKERDEARAELAKAGGTEFVSACLSIAEPVIGDPLNFAKDAPPGNRVLYALTKAIGEAQSAHCAAKSAAELAKQATAIANAVIEERDAAQSELARLTTPRPIDEAPKNGTPVIGRHHDEDLAIDPEIVRWEQTDDGSFAWIGCATGIEAAVTQFLPLPVKP